MNDPQVWTLIGVFTAIMIGGMTLMTTLLNRTMAAGFKAVDAKFEAVDARFDALDARLSGKIALLDKDIETLTRRVFGDDRA